MSQSCTVILNTPYLKYEYHVYCMYARNGTSTVAVSFIHEVHNRVNKTYLVCLVVRVLRTYCTLGKCYKSLCLLGVASKCIRRKWAILSVPTRRGFLGREGRRRRKESRLVWLRGIAPLSAMQFLRQSHSTAQKQVISPIPCCKKILVTIRSICV